jgi:hypothetical protein
MDRRTLIKSAALLVAPTSALASGGSKEAKKEVGQYVDLLPVGLPVVVERRLVTYVFVYVRLNLASNADVSRWRQKEPLFRDALVRAAHRTPFTAPKDPTRVDEARVSATLMREAVGITGPGVVRSVVVTSQTLRGRAPAHKA